MSEAMQQIALIDDMEDKAALEAVLVAADADILRVLDRLAEQAIADKLLAEVAEGRADRFDARSGMARDLIRRIMDALELSKLERPTFTASLAEGPKSVVISEEAEIPERYIRHAPDKPAIKRALAAGEDVPGATLSNGAPVLRLLTR